MKADGSSTLTPLGVRDATCPDCGAVVEISEILKVICCSPMLVVTNGDVAVKSGDDTSYVDGDHTTIGIRCDVCLAEFPTEMARRIIVHAGIETSDEPPERGTL